MMNNIIIFGCGRSGTSLVTGAIATAGQKYNLGGKIHKPDRFNEKGYFETNTINCINDDILWSCSKTETLKINKSRRQGWLSIIPVDAKIDSCTNDIKHRICDVIKNQPYLFKDPRFSYTLPVWLNYLQNCKFICVFRHPSEFLQSVTHTCETAEYLAGIVIDKEFFQKMWLNTYLYISHNYSHLNIFYINCNQFIKGSGNKMLSDFVGHEINTDFADKKLMHFSSNNFDLCADNKSVELYNKLCCLADCPEELK